ncbi:MAG: glycosyltransferase family 4 protein [Alphaproteobacteria bacterium]
MKVLVNAISAKRGGIVTYTGNLMRAFAEHDVDALFAVPEDFPAPQGARILRVKASGYSPLRRFAWEQTFWHHTVAQYRPDVLFSSANFSLLHSPVPQVLLMREGGLFDPTYLVNFAPEQGVAAALQRDWRRRLMLLSAQRAHHIVTPSRAMRDMLLAWSPGLAARTSVNSYGTLGDAFTPAERPRQWAEDGVLRLLYVSVYYPHKCPGLLCRAVEDLNDRGIPVHATITMELKEIEATRGGAHDAILVRRAAERGFLTLGRTPYRELPQLYRSHDLFMFPAIAETFGHPMAEALSCGMPVVAIDTPINREVCGDAASYFPPFSVSALCDRITELHTTPELRGQLAGRARGRVLSNFLWDDHVVRLLDTFQKLKAGVRI